MIFLLVKSNLVQDLTPAFHERPSTPTAYHPVATFQILPHLGLESVRALVVKSFGPRGKEKDNGDKKSGRIERKNHDSQSSVQLLRHVQAIVPGSGGCLHGGVRHGMCE
jgi:hypothetical protein